MYRSFLGGWQESVSHAPTAPEIAHQIQDHRGKEQNTDVYISVCAPGGHKLIGHPEAKQPPECQVESDGAGGADIASLPLVRAGEENHIAVATQRQDATERCADHAKSDVDEINKLNGGVKPVPEREGQYHCGYSPGETSNNQVQAIAATQATFPATGPLCAYVFMYFCHRHHSLSADILSRYPVSSRCTKSIICSISGTSGISTLCRVLIALRLASLPSLRISNGLRSQSAHFCIQHRIEPENTLQRQIEISRQSQRQLNGWHIPPHLQRQNRMAGDIEVMRQLFLRQTMFLAQFAQTIENDCFHRTSRFLRTLRASSRDMLS